MPQISAVIGEPRGGDLSWCGKVPNCKLSSYAEWAFEGGQVRLESRQDAQSLELTLSHEHEDMNERVVHGLPYCG